MYLAICANAVGLDFKISKYYCPNGYSSNGRLYWTTNFLTPVGWSNASQVSWFMHQIAHPSDSTKVYDAAAALVLDPSGAEWGLATFGWSLNSWWQSGSYGLVSLPSPAQRTETNPQPVSIINI